MKSLVITISTLVLFGLSSCGDASNENKEGANQQSDTSAMPAPQETAEQGSTKEAPDSATIAKAWENYMTPGPMHKMMASTDGKWDVEMRSCSYPGGPLGEPSKAKAENKMILNGLYQESTFKGNMMGMPFEGKGIMGYDNARKKFVSTWVDNMGTGVLHLEGDYDENTKTFEFNGKSTDPVSGGEEDFKEVVRIIDDKKHVMEMYGVSEGKEYKMLEITMTKK